MTQMHRVSWTEACVILILACIAAGTAYWRSWAIDPIVYSDHTKRGFDAVDIWFDGDINQIFTMMSIRRSYAHAADAQHPLLSLAVYPPILVLRRAAGMPPLQGVHFTWAVLATLWTIALFALLRITGCPVFDAGILTAAGIASAASVFWFCIPESFSVGSLTIVVALFLSAVAARTKSPVTTFGFVNLLSLSITVSNWMLGIFAAALNLPWRRAMVAICGGFVGVALLWGVEKLVFPRAPFMLTQHEWADYLFAPTPSRALEVVPAFFLHTMIMPEIKLVQLSPDQIVMKVQNSFPGSGSVAGYIAAAAWLALLALGIRACVSAFRQDKVVQLVCLTTGAQLGLHLLLGNETFLYSMHFLPLLLVIAARGTLTRSRVPALVLAVVVTVGALINNQAEFLRAVALVKTIVQVAGPGVF